MSVKPAWLLALTAVAIVVGIVLGSWLYRLAAGG